MDARRLTGIPFVVATAVSLMACVAAGRTTPTPSLSVGSPGADRGQTPGTTSAIGGPTASPSFIRPTPNPSPTFLVYEVRAGDSLTSIARQFGTTARSIAYWNRAAYPSLDPDSPDYEPDRIEVGWTLQLIPTSVVDEDELPDPTPTPTPTPGSPAPSSSAGP